MTKFLFLFLFFLSLLSCRDDAEKSIEERVNSSDTNCLKEIARAKSDIKVKKLVFCKYGSFRARKETDSLLKLKNVAYKEATSSCVIEENRYYNCYCEYMQEQINLKYGNKFTDSLLYIADSLFILQHLDRIYDNRSEKSKWDKAPVFPGDISNDQTNHSGLQNEFDKKVKYPKGYKYKNGEHSGAMMKFHLEVDTMGNAKVADTQYLFWDYVTKEEDYNNEFYQYFRDIAVSLIKNTKWTPAKIKGLNVISKSEIFVYLK